MDFGVLEGEDGEDDYVFTIEPKFEDSETLRSFFMRKAPTKKDFEDIVSGVTDTVYFASQEGFYHRDLHDKNIMVRQKLPRAGLLICLLNNIMNWLGRGEVFLNLENTLKLWLKLLRGILGWHLKEAREILEI
ncbi:MAG: hypothetical protein ABH864_05595 [archaeon]